jgi:hypothetical protein
LIILFAEYGARKILQDEKFLDRLLASCFHTEKIEIVRAAMQTLLFLIKFARAEDKKALIEKGVLADLEKMVKSMKDPEANNLAMFCLANFIHDFPLEAMRSMSTIFVFPKLTILTMR